MGFSRDQTTGIIFGVFVVIVIVLIIIASLLWQNSQDEQMKACMATGNHSWVKSGDGMECQAD